MDAATGNPGSSRVATDRSEPYGGAVFHVTYAPGAADGDQASFPHRLCDAAPHGRPNARSMPGDPGRHPPYAPA